MHSNSFNVAVVLLWLALMSWLAMTKVLPPLLVGEPPSLSRIVAAQSRVPTVGWNISLQGRRAGWALTETQPQSSGVTEIHGRVHFDALPLRAILPGWLAALPRFIGGFPGRPKLDAWSVLLIDPLGRLSRFDSKIRLSPWSDIISVGGAVEGNKLQGQVRIGGVPLDYETYLPPDALPNDALLPQTELPGLHVGQKWTVPVYNPLWPSNGPVAIVQATVEGMERISWEEDLRDSWLVTYRDSTSTGVDQKPLAKLWVGADGAVLKQEVTLLDSTVTFVRMTDAEARETIKGAGRRWWSMEIVPPWIKSHD